MDNEDEQQTNKNILIKEEIFDYCEYECPNNEHCQEMECVLYRIEQIVGDDEE